jgi:hypothetical protein
LTAFEHLLFLLFDYSPAQMLCSQGTERAGL